MASIASRRTIRQLLKQGYNEIPEVLTSTGLALVGLGLAVVGCYNYVQQDGDNKRYKKTFIIMRPDDPQVKRIKKE